MDASHSYARRSNEAERAHSWGVIHVLLSSVLLSFFLVGDGTDRSLLLIGGAMLLAMGLGVVLPPQYVAARRVMQLVAAGLAIAYLAVQALLLLD